MKRTKELVFASMQEMRLWVLWIKKQFAFQLFKERVFNLGGKVCLSIEYKF